MGMLSYLLSSILYCHVYFAGVAVTLGVLRAAEVGKATADFFSGILGGNKPSGKKSGNT